MRTLFGLTLCCILSRSLLFAQVRQAHVDPHTIILPVVDGKDIRFTRLSTEDGLSQTMVSQIVQDDQGFMWFGSQYGLNRYDGYKFKVFKHEPGVPNSLERGATFTPCSRTVPARFGLDAMSSWINSTQ